MITFFFFYDTNIDQLPPIDEVKGCLKRLYSLGVGIGAHIADSDKKLAQDLSNLAYRMFCYHKQHKKTFTVCNNRKLRDMRISDDGDGFSEQDSLFITSFIEENLLDIFAELVAYSFLPDYKTYPSCRLYVASVQSRYSGKEHFVFFVNCGADVFVFNDNVTTIKLSDYIANYFSASTVTDDNIQKVCKVVISDASFLSKQKEILEAFSSFNKKVNEKHDFIHGAITFLDFLGWKGLWQSQNGQSSLQQVSELIEDFKQELEKMSQSYFLEAKDIPLSSLISISDTIAIFTPKTSSITICELLNLHSQFSKYVLEQCCKNKYAIRGAITYGEYSTMKNIMIGPGIDECASWHETANWIGVHLTPTAQILWDMSDHDETSICPYASIPLKAGLKANYCVKWKVSKDVFNGLVQKNRALLPEIAGKYINTQAFLKDVVWEDSDHVQK